MGINSAQPVAPSKRRLDAAPADAKLAVMLQHNTGAGSAAGARAHIAHAAMIALHALCCGLPVVAMALMAMAGAGSGLTAFAATTGELHGFLHARELWVLGASVVLVGAGAAFELHNRRRRGGGPFPWLFALSAACLMVNIAIMAAHYSA